MKQGLVLEGGDGEEPTLLTLPSLYEDLRTYSLDDDGDNWEVRASSLIEKTPRFELFHFRSSCPCASPGSGAPSASSRALRAWPR